MQVWEPCTSAIPWAFVAIWRSCSRLIETTHCARACFQCEDMRDEFGKSSAALLVPYSPPSPDPVPPLPRGINTIRGRKCGNPQQRAPSLNTNNQRPPNNTESALPSTLLFYVWASENLLLSSQYYHSDFSCQLLERIIWRGYAGLIGVQIESSRCRVSPTD